jgi:pyrimidine and pyridine-specific 5'-nucleotidase
LKRPSISRHTSHLPDQPAGPPLLFHVHRLLPLPLPPVLSGSLETIMQPRRPRPAHASCQILPSRLRASQKHRASPAIDFTSASPSKYKNTHSASVRVCTSSVASIHASNSASVFGGGETPQHSKRSSTLPSPASNTASSKPQNIPQSQPLHPRSHSRPLRQRHSISLVQSQRTPSVRRCPV